MVSGIGGTVPLVGSSKVGRGFPHGLPRLAAVRSLLAAVRSLLAAVRSLLAAVRKQALDPLSGGALSHASRRGGYFLGPQAVWQGLFTLSGEVVALPCQRVTTGGFGVTKTASGASLGGEAVPRNAVFIPLVAGWTVDHVANVRPSGTGRLSGDSR